jgi:cephalosporin hydroxylase
MKTSLDHEPTPALTAADVCDRCSTRAVVETGLTHGGSLLWCGHHFAVFLDALTTSGATILRDDRHRQPSVTVSENRSGRP